MRKQSITNNAKELATSCWHTEETNTIATDSRLAKAVAKVIESLLERIIQLELSEELAWGLIANAYGGDWDQASLDWKMAAERWRDSYQGGNHESSTTE